MDRKPPGSNVDRCPEVIPEVIPLKQHVVGASTNRRKHNHPRRHVKQKPWVESTFGRQPVAQAKGCGDTAQDEERVPPNVKGAERNRDWIVELWHANPAGERRLPARP